ncbi:transposase [Citricoccus sp. NR2]|uniref:transposase n=1 Tax=Citricoccus sp. NR2 TaxID=3004095 RepID=UPI0022DE7D85|nr:transposase [Citricoccus sp. NR2]WBL18791.1 transposase [Citricoccus sp. NR2]
MIRQLKVAHDTALKDRTGAMITLKAMLIHASEDLRRETAGKTQKMIARHCAGLRPRGLNTPEDANRHVLRSIAKRWMTLNDEIIELEEMIKDLVAQRAPHLLERFGIGVDTAAEILIVAGDNPERIRNEAAFAKLAGISPIPAGSGMTSGKHRINQGGHRQLNAAILPHRNRQDEIPRTHNRLRRTPNC